MNGFQEELEPKASLAPGSILANRYSIQKALGVGGMGSVYLARDNHFPNVIKLVAVKEMINQAPDPLVRKTIVQNFEREANILVTLSHPSIPKIFDYFSSDDRSYLVLEYINGKDLENILDETNAFLSESKVITWGIELCDVLYYLHNHQPVPIIFRDMKPSNIMINQQGHIVLVDFGIAKNFAVGQKGTMIGTEGYSPPEQYRGEACPQGDIYALGATLHHLLTRQDPRLEPPFTFSERPIRKINQAVSPEFEVVINTALQYNVADRFQNVVKMKEALIAIGQKTGIITRYYDQTNVSLDELSIKPLWTFKCEDEIRGTATYDNNIIFVGSYDHNLYALNEANGQFIWKFATEAGIVTRPCVNEGSIYFGSEDKQLYSISTRTGKILWSYSTEGPVRSSPCIAEGHIFFGSDDGYLYAVNVISNRRIWRFDAGAAIRSTPFITSDMVYFGSENGECLCLDFRGEVKWRYRAKRPISASPLVVQGIIYFTSMDSTVVALDAKSGWLIWRYRMAKGSVSSPSKQDNYLFFGSADHNIYCIDSTNAKEIWRFQTDHQVSGSPLHYKNAIYIGSVDGNLYCLDSRSGRLLWKYSTGGPITGSPTIHNDILFIGSHDHNLYALPA